jgi:hypothetical protein
LAKDCEVECDATTVLAEEKSGVDTVEASNVRACGGKFAPAYDSTGVIGATEGLAISC